MGSTAGKQKQGQKSKSFMERSRKLSDQDSQPVSNLLQVKDSKHPHGKRVKSTGILSAQNTDEDSDHSAHKKMQGPDNHLSFSLSISSRDNSAARGNEVHPLEPQHDQGTPNLEGLSRFRQEMLRRWKEEISNIPEQDYVDQMALTLNQRIQQAAEYSQEIYMHMRAEESQNQLAQKDSNCQRFISDENRDKYAHRVVELCMMKNYREETCHLALNIFDRGLLSGKLPDSSPEFMLIVVVTCVILAAKVAQPLTPSIKMTIKCLREGERDLVTKPQVLEVERVFLNILDFDLSTLSSLTFVERYVRLLNLEMHEPVSKVAKKICTATRCKYQYSHYLPSVLAAGALILSLSFYNSESKTPVIETWNDDLERMTLHSRLELGQVVHALEPIYKTMLENRSKF